MPLGTKDVVAFQIPLPVGYGGIEDDPVPMIEVELEVPFQIPVLVGYEGMEDDPVPTIAVEVEVLFQIPVVVGYGGMEDDPVPTIAVEVEVPFQIPVLLYDGMEEEPVPMGAVGPALRVELWKPGLVAVVDVGDKVTAVEDIEDTDDKEVAVEDIVEEVEVAGFAHLLSVNWLLMTSTKGLLSIRFCSE